METALALWYLVVGGVFGSFLNVVIYRLPARLSLVRPASHCPICKHPIRWRDNVPVLGWLLLGGRCRDCKVRIPIRYPLVEAAVALMFAAVGWADQFAIGPAAYHLVLLCTLLCAAGIEWDGHRMPGLLLLPAEIMGAVAALIWPEIHRVLAWPLRIEKIDTPLEMLVGTALGFVLGLAAWRLIGPRDRPGIFGGAVCVGLFLGWQAVAVLIPLTVAGQLLLVHGFGSRWPALRRWPSSGMLWLAATAWIVVPPLLPILS